MSKILMQIATLIGVILIPVTVITAQKTDNSGLNCYTPGKAFQSNDDPDCFTLTKNEADIAFARGCWEDAGKLYRAAKLCRDATQMNRTAMNERIKACSEAAAAALQNERDKAVRQARQAIASNRASDAQELLRKNDRSLAYRLAKFANEYIAPPGEDNPDCLQAIFDAWQQKAPETDQKIKPVLPFCYELLHTEDDSVTVRFVQHNGRLELFAFSPKRHELYQWEAPGFELLSFQKIDSTMQYFDLSPDGSIWLFSNPNSFLLMKNGKKQYIYNSQPATAYCFSPDSKIIYYFDQAQMAVNSNNTDELFTPAREKKNAKSNNFQAYQGPRSIFRTDKTPKKLAWANEHLWLVYNDIVVVYQVNPEKNGRLAWQELTRFDLNFPKKELIDGSSTNGQLLISKDHKTVFWKDYGTFQTCHVEYNNGRYTCTPEEIQSGILISNQKLWVQNGDYSSSTFYLERSESLIQSIHFDEYTTVSSPHRGDLALSTPERSGKEEWLAISDATGILRLWRLTGNFSGNASQVFSKSGYVACSENGVSFANCRPNQPEEFINSANKTETFPVVEFPQEPSSVHIEVSPKGWIACGAIPGDTIILSNRKNIWKLSGSVYDDFVFRFDYTGKYFAYLSDADSIDIFEMDEGQMKHVAGRRFDLSISHICFIPGKDALVVQRTVYGEDAQSSFTIPKIWYFKTAGKPDASVRMEQFQATLIGASPDGANIFFSDGSTVRIYQANNLTDESAAIRQKGREIFINAIAPHPSKPILAVAYNDGTIACYNTQSGKKLYQITAVRSNLSNQDQSQIRRVAFTKDGDQLIAILNNIAVYYFDLNVGKIQEKTALAGGQLVAFGPEQIGQWELDKALEIEGNFSKLAKSGDLPLIRSFFEFFSKQSLNSNNIDDVQVYCKRASELYELLDNDSKKTQKPTMLSMYDDYLWKLLQRNKVKEAEAVINQQNTASRFKGTLTILRTSAHAALLRNDLTKAARLYLDWCYQEKETPVSYDVFSSPALLTSNLSLLNDYGFLDARQRGFLCTFFDGIQTLDESFCEGSELFSDPSKMFVEEADYLKWQIFKIIENDNTDQNVTFSAKQQLLSKALALAQKLQQSRRAEGKELAEQIKLFQTDLLVQQGDFEAYSNPAAGNRLYTQAIAVIEQEGNFIEKYELNRLTGLAKLYLKRGNNALFNNIKPAIADFNHALELTNKAKTLAAEKNNNLLEINQLEQTIYTQKGRAMLLSDQPAQARALFEQADLATDLAVNTLNIANAYLLEGDTASANLNFSTIQYAYQLAGVLSDLQQYGYAFKNTQKSRFEQFQVLVKNLKASTMLAHPEFDPEEIEYAYYENMMGYFFATGKLDSVYIWSKNKYLNDKSNWDKGNYNHDKEYTIAPNIMRTCTFISQSVLYVHSKDAPLLTEALSFSEDMLQNFSPKYSRGKAQLVINKANILLVLGESAKASELYASPGLTDSYLDYSLLDYLMKDWRDLYQAGIKPAGLSSIAKAVFPVDYPFTKEEKEVIGER